MIAFTADNHVGVTSQWSMKERRDDFLKGFREVVEGALASGARSLIIGGDLFNTTTPQGFAVAFVKREIDRLAGFGCTAYGIDGNHDISGGSWLRVCGITPLDDVPAVVSHTPKVTACGISYRKSDDVLATINSMADRGVKCDILVLHLALGELNRMGATSDIAGAEVSKALHEMCVRLVLMGHIHIRQSVVVDGITFAYCGSTEMCSMNEPRDKSFELVDPATMALTRVPIATRKIEHAVIGTEEEFSRFEAGLEKGTDVLQSVFVSSMLVDGVKRLRDLAKARECLMRIQVVHPEGEAKDPVFDRSTGVTGLEQAISLSFAPDSAEAAFIKACIRSPETAAAMAEDIITGKGKEGKEEGK